MTSEHTIGIWKGRFPWLRMIPNKITERKSSIRRILKYIDCCVILHNMLLKWKDEAPEIWEEDIPDVEEETFDNTMSLPITEDMAKDERRQRLLVYYKDYVF